MECSLGGRCGGCPLYGTPYEQQKNQKLDHFKSVWSQAMGVSLPVISFIEVKDSGLRDRADLTWHIHEGSGRLGLYDLDRHEILDMQECPQMSPALSAWFQDFRRLKFPVPLGSLRLRVGPRGDRGVWLDFSNLNVKNLFDEAHTLRALMEMAHVEVGQRRKVLTWDGERLRLTDPQPKPWFETYVRGQPVELSCSIADFTQPSMWANKVLVSEVEKLVSDSDGDTWVEFGPGIGNFTIPLAQSCSKLKTYERDPYMLRTLEKNIAFAGIEDKVQVHRGDFQKQSPNFTKVTGVFVDPPRSGLGNFLENLENLSKGERPPKFLYVSCYAESFCHDSQALYKLGYQLEKLSLVDQFPQSRHFEMVAEFKL